MLGSDKISKQEFYKLGGFANPMLWRKQQSNGVWAYYRRRD